MKYIGAYYRGIVYDWTTHGENDHARLLNYLHTIEAALDGEMNVYPKHWIYPAWVIVMARCALQKGKAARKWVEHAAQHSRALSGSDGGWDAIARESEKSEWWGTWNKPRLRGNLGLTRTRGIDALDIINSLWGIFRKTTGVKW